jgi:hypothetical protein
MGANARRFVASVWTTAGSVSVGSPTPKAGEVQPLQDDYKPLIDFREQRESNVE